MLERKREGKQKMNFRTSKTAGNFVIEDATDDARAYASTVLAPAGKARIQTNGLIIVQDYFRPQFEIVIPEFANHEQMMKFLDENLNSSKAYNYFDSMSHREFNRRFSGKIIAAAEEYGFNCAA